MAKGGFRRQRLLDVKSILLNLRSIALRESEDKERGRKKQLASIRARKQDHLHNAATEKVDKPVTTVRALQVDTWYTEQLNEDLREQVQEVRQAEREVHERRRIVEQSAKEKKSLEKLKERQELAARKERDRKEQKTLDEIAERRRSPRRRGGDKP